jgi:hypothetical protein
MNATNTTNQIAQTDVKFEDPMLDDIGGSFGLLVPILLPGGNYGEAQALYEELTAKISEVMRSLHVSIQTPELITF